MITLLFTKSKFFNKKTQFLKGNIYLRYQEETYRILFLQVLGKLFPRKLLEEKLSLKEFLLHSKSLPFWTWPFEYQSHEKGLHRKNYFESCCAVWGFIFMEELLTLPATRILESCSKVKININFYFHTFLVVPQKVLWRPLTHS